MERTITGDALVAALTKVFAAHGGPPKVLRLDNGPQMFSLALQQFCENNYIPPRFPRDNGYIRSFNNRLRKECLNRNYWNTLLQAHVVIGDFKHKHNHRHSALGYRTPADTLRRAGAPTSRCPAASTDTEQTNPSL